jgi:hypothetical protein
MNISYNKIKTQIFVFIMQPLFIFVFIIIAYILLFAYYNNPILCDDTSASAITYTAQELMSCPAEQENILQLRSVVNSELEK